MTVKGFHGEATWEAARVALISLGNRASADALFEEIKSMGDWRDGNIWQTLLAHVINLPASYGHWSDTPVEKRFLFVLEDGDYELYNPQLHGEYLRGRRIQSAG